MNIFAKNIKISVIFAFAVKTQWKSQNTLCISKAVNKSETPNYKQ